ncbi:MAG: type II/IV secretion system protein [Phycisphaerae bacterium]|nr:type II/IV secretion system protein [Phycisphaerae bacterium]
MPHAPSQIEAKTLREAGVAPSPEFLARIPHEFARRHLVLSRGCECGVERLAVAERTPPWIVHNVGVRLGRATTAAAEPAEVIAVEIDAAYAESNATRGGSGGTAAEGSREERVVVTGSTDVSADLAAAIRDADLLHTGGKAPAVRLVDLILFEALTRSASDVHVQPLRGRTLVRYRLDGVLHTVRELPASLAAAVVSRIKVMARLDVAESRAPQDGRATVTIGGSGALSERRVDLRVGTLPSTYGERVVVRLLDPARSAYLASFTGLGMPPAVERDYLAQVGRPSGIVLATGPTGSGKTTTLYTTLAWLSNAHAGSRGCELNMMTIEDPVEYDLAGAAGTGDGGLAVSQTQVDPKKSVTFASGLRHILRQDPDVIMVGEVRDQETARIAVQASLTGHLVLSTLHTSDAPSAVARLIDLGVEPFLVASSLSAVLAQRLVRRTHAPCAGHGCDECLRTGFRGRTGVFELLVLDHAIRELVARRASAVEIKDAAQRAGMVTLREAATRLVRDGVTTSAEVARVVESIEVDA